MEAMAIFGLIMMGVIAITLTHLANWFFRMGKEDYESPGWIFGGIMFTLFSIMLIYQLVINSLNIYTS